MYCSNSKCFQSIVLKCCQSCRQICQKNQLCHECIWLYSCGRCGAKKEKETNGQTGENDICSECEVILLVEKNYKLAFFS